MASYGNLKTRDYNGSGYGDIAIALYRRFGSDYLPYVNCAARAVINYERGNLAQRVRVPGVVIAGKWNPGGLRSSGDVVWLWNLYPFVSAGAINRTDSWRAIYARVTGSGGTDVSGYCADVDGDVMRVAWSNHVSNMAARFLASKYPGNVGAVVEFRERWQPAIVRALLAASAGNPGAIVDCPYEQTATAGAVIDHYGLGGLLERLRVARDTIYLGVDGKELTGNPEPGAPAYRVITQRQGTRHTFTYEYPDPDAASARAQELARQRWLYALVTVSGPGNDRFTYLRLRQDRNGYYV